MVAAANNSTIGGDLHRFHSSGHHEVIRRDDNNIGIHPRDAGEKLSLQEVSNLESTTQATQGEDESADRTQAAILSINPGENQKELNIITNSFAKIHERIEKLFKEDPELKDRQSLKDDVYQFLNTLDWRLIFKPDPSLGRYVTGVANDSTFQILGHLKFPMVMEFLTKKLGASEVLDDNYGIYEKAGKAVIAGGSLSLNFATVGDENIIDLLNTPDQMLELGAYADKTNMVAGYINGDKNRVVLVNNDTPANNDDFLGTDESDRAKKHILNHQHGGTLDEHGNSSYEFRPANTGINVATVYAPHAELGQVLTSMSKNTPGYKTLQFSDLMNRRALRLAENKTLPQGVVIRPTELPEYLSADVVHDFLARRIASGEGMPVTIADTWDEIAEEEARSSSSDDSSASA